MTFSFKVARSAYRVYRGPRLAVGGPCRVVWDGPMPADGGPLMIIEGRYRRERQRACYELKFGRTMKSDRIVAACGNARCLDYRHLHAIPAPKAPKATRARAVTAQAAPEDAPHLT